LLKQAYDRQRSAERSWQQIDDILVVLETACYYLDFHEDAVLEERLVAEADEAQSDPDVV
jgi:hypothetical protein